MLYKYYPSAVSRNIASPIVLLALLALACNSACTTMKPLPAVNTKPPVSPELYRTIARLDSAMFVAFNQHAAEKLQTYFAQDPEF